MKIFNKKGFIDKVNFVDENNVFVGYDLQQDCCEEADWFIADRAIDGIEDTEASMLEGLKPYRFDSDYFVEHNPGGDCDLGGIAIFRLVAPSQPDRYLHLYNSHNGYYCHGFEMKKGYRTLQSGLL